MNMSCACDGISSTPTGVTSVTCMHCRCDYVFEVLSKPLPQGPAKEDNDAVSLKLAQRKFTKLCTEVRGLGGTIPPCSADV